MILGLLLARQVFMGRCLILRQCMRMRVQATAGMEDDEEFEGMNGRPGNTIGQPSIMNGLNRHMVHTTSTISNAPNVPVRS